MQIHTLASGSAGNSTLICDNNTSVLIDAGISARRLCSALGQLGLTMDGLSGILITHEHSDHVRGLDTLIKHFEVPIFAPRTVANHLRWSIAGVEDYIKELTVGSETAVGGLSIVPFRTPHDTPESVGYRITGSRRLGFCTDCGHVTDEIWEGLKGVDAAVLEANHDPRRLMDGPYPAMLKRRILSDNGHLSNKCCGELAVRLAESGTRQFVLAHLSRENNTPALALNTVFGVLKENSIDPENHVSVAVAPEKDIFSLSLEVYSKC